MKIKEVQIKNFRSVKELKMQMQDLTVLVGPNNAGKTNILAALRLFFNSSLRGVTEEDCYLKNLKDAIEIVVVFSQFSESEKKRFDRYLVNGEVRVKKTIWFEEGTGFKSKLQGCIREPLNPILKESEFESNRATLKQKVDSGELPRYFLSESSRITKESFEKGRERYLEEKKAEIEWDEPSWSESFFGWKSVAEGYMMDILYVPAVREAAEESKISSKSYFGQLIEFMLNKLTPSEGLTNAGESLAQIKRALSGAEDGTGRLPEIDQLETKLSESLSEYMPGVHARLNMAVPQLADIIRSFTSLTIDDGISTTIEAKGHGLQRSIILTIFRLYANMLKELEEDGHQVGRTAIFALEEPELYLHPQLQRRLFQILRSIANVDQFICCTHSPYFVSVPDYKDMVLVTKDNLVSGTGIKQFTGELFGGEGKKQFRMLTEFDPNKNELFFAKKVVLVEGPTEKVILELAAKKMGKSLDELGITIVECEGKESIPFFEEVLNAFGISYVVLHDTDIHTGDSTDIIRKHEEMNSGIKEKAGTNKVLTFDPDFETQNGLTGHSPFSAFTALYDVAVDGLPTSLKEKVLDILS